MLSTIGNLEHFCLDSVTKTLNIEQTKGISSSYGDFGADPQFRRSLLEFLQEQPQRSIQQISVKSGSVEFVYGEHATTKIIAHAKTSQPKAYGMALMNRW